jgi:citrate lyase beta subunit
MRGRTDPGTRCGTGGRAHPTARSRETTDSATLDSPAVPLGFRSLLFVPAHDPARVAGASSSGADAVVADLETAVPADRKAEARKFLTEVLPVQSPVARLVRVNIADSPEFPADLETVAGLALDALVLPKATADAVTMLGPSGPPLVAVVETARGLNEAALIASFPRVEALLLGAFDLSAELGLEPRPDALELLYARSKLVVDSAAAGIRRPFDRVYPVIDDPEGLQEDARFARSLGFGGKACTDTRQPTIINRVFEQAASVGVA